MNNLVGQAERVAHIVSGWFSGHPDAPTHTTHSHADTHSTPSGAASYAASVVSSYWNTYIHGKKGEEAYPPPSSSSSFSSSYSSLSSFWNQHQWLNNPSAALDSFLWNYTPDLRSLQHRFGLDENAMDKRIIALAMLLPLVLLLLITVFFMGAGHTDENSHPGLQRNIAGPALVGGKKATGKGSSKFRGSGSTSSKTKGSQMQHKKSGGAQDNIGPDIPIEGNTLGSWLALLGSSGFTGAEKLAYKPVDIIAAMKELDKESKVLDHTHTERRNSWSSMVGAMGYTAGEMETHAPYKHLEGKHLGQILGDTAAPAHENVGAPEQRHAKESVADKAKEDIIGPTAVQHEQDELGLDNQEKEDEDERLQRQEEEEMAARLIAIEEQSMAAAKTKVKANSDKAKVSSKKDAKESTERPTYASKVKTHMPGAFVEAEANAAEHGFQHEFGTTTNRDKKQGSKSVGGSKSTVPLRTRTPRPESSKHKSVAASSSSPALAEGSIGSRLWDYAQSSSFLKNVDSISGGLFGTAVATVAALANTAEAATTLVKDNVPHKLSGLADDLKDSFEYHMKTDDDIEGLGAGPYGDGWDIRQALNKIHNMHDTEHRSHEENQAGLSFSVQDITVGPRTSCSLQVPRVDTGVESELSDGEQELNEELMQRLNEPRQQATVHPHDESSPGATTVSDGLLHPEEYTIDAQGNKVPVTDNRRDSGHDMLV